MTHVFAVVAVAAGLAVGLAAPAGAGSGEWGASWEAGTVAAEASAVDPGIAPDGGGGAASAILCGLFARFVRDGMGAGAIAGAVAACLYMVFDAMTG